MSQSSQSADDRKQLVSTLLSLVNAQTWNEVQQIVEQHPELLQLDAEAVLGQMEIVQNDAEVVRVLQQCRELLRHCRDVGITHAFAEKLLSAEGLIEAARRGLTPEEFLAQLRAAPRVPPEFEQDHLAAEEAEQLYLRTGDPVALDSAAAAWSRILEHAAFSSAPEHFRLRALNNAGIILAYRYRARGGVDDLNYALELWGQAVQATPPNSPDLPARLNNLGNGLGDRFARTGQEPDLEQAIRAYEHAVKTTPPGSHELPMYLNNLGTGLSKRFARTGREADLEAAIQVFQRAVNATPPDSPELPGHLSNLGNGFRSRFARTGQEADLDESIRLYRWAVQATPSDSPGLTGYLSNLGVGLSDRFARTGREADLNEAIRSWQQAVKATAPDSPKLPSILNNLGNGLRDRFARTGREADLEEAIRVWQQAVQTTPPDAPQLPIYLSSLGAGLRARFAYTGREADLEEGIRVSQQAVQATPPDSPDLPICLNGLGSGLHDRFVRTGQEADLNGAIRIWQQTLQAMPPDSPNLPSILNQLASGLRDRFARTGREADLEESIRVSQQAMQATPPHSPKLPSILNNLGNSLRDRFGRRGRQTDLEEAIRVSQQAVQATPPGSPDLPSFLNNLGLGMRIRFERTGREADLDEAIRVWRQAVSATPPDSSELPMYLNNLGTGLHVRFMRTGQEADLEEAIRLHRQAVEATALPGSPDLAMYLSNLGNGLRDRFGRTRHEADLEEAIRVLEQAVKATPNSPDRPMYLNNLAAGLQTRFEHTGWEVDLKNAIGVYQQTVQATPPDSPNLPIYLNNLGNALINRFTRTEQRSDLEEAVRVLQRAVQATPQDSPHLPTSLNNLGNGLRNRFRRSGQEADLQEAIRVYRRICKLGDLSDPQAALDAARNWGRWAIQRKQWGETAEAYGCGLATGRQLLARQMLREHKENWLRDLQEMSSAAAYALAKLGRYEEAAATMERGRARLLAEALQRRRRDLEQLPTRGHEELYWRYREIVERQERLTQLAAAWPEQPASVPGQSRLDAILAANIAFEQVVAEIQKVPGYADFLTEPTFAQVQAVANDAPVAYLLATSAGGLALIIHAGNAQPIWLDALTDVAVHDWLAGCADHPALGGWLGAYQNWLVKHTLPAQQAWLTAIDDVTKQIWIHLMHPLAEALHQLSRPEDSRVTPPVTLIPAGLLALLPLHAAWTEDASTPTGRRYFVDEFTINYVPSALALHHARDRVERAADGRLLAVEEPLAASASRLPNVHAEVTAIAGLFHRSAILAREQGTRAAVRAALPKADVVHFSCHGNNNWESPLDSGLLMADDETGKNVLLTVRDFLESGQAAGRLVTLSACETGIVGTKLPDEAVALPSALLQAGYNGVVASLWSVSDISTAMLMEHFYRCWREDRLPPAQALRAAQRWLRDTTNQEKAEYFKRYSPQLSAGMRMPEAETLRFFNQLMSRNLDSRDFAHPFWWAAFYLTGV